ncbi:ROK family protein [Streptomyces hokutonensis]|uniref:ROK family protein n=1 Tax=Streptomyces hokutonensis TaxID=1306990 RepID=UPI0003796953|nr:ROK family protein [Streptomyces hokutonensis]
MGYLGIDIGGTKVALRLESEGHDPLESVFHWPRDTGAARRDVAMLRHHADALLARWRRPLTAVGVAMPATVDGTGRVATWPGRPGWRGLDLRTELRELFPGTAVRMADDGDLAALAEADAAACGNVVYLGVGTGIGGGIVHGGRPFPGPAAGSCEIGHMTVDRFGPRCDCGRRGCLQSLASGPSTLRRAAELLGREVEFTELRDAADALLPWAVATLDETCSALATAVVSLTELARPEQVVIGGGFADALPGLVPQIAGQAALLARPGGPRAVIGRASLGGLSSLYGALLLARGE